MASHGSVDKGHNPYQTEAPLHLPLGSSHTVHVLACTKLPPASGPLHMPYFQAGISSLPPSTPKCSPVSQVPFLGKSGQGPPNPCPFGSWDFCSQDVSQFVVGIYDSQLFVCSGSSNGPSPPSTLLTMVSLGIGTVWGTETLNI